MKNEIIDRELYRKIKKMNRQELNDFFEKTLVSIDQIEIAISSIPGIGPKRLEEIMEKLKLIFPL